MAVRSLINVLGFLALGSIFFHAGASLVRIISSSAPDFGVLYDASALLLQGISPYRHVELLYTAFNYPPVSALLYLPFLLLPVSVSQAVWIILSVIGLFLSVSMSLRILKRDTRENILCAVALAFLSFPTKFTLGMGQTNLLALAFLVGAVYYEKIKMIPPVFFALAVLLKPQLLLVVLFQFFTSARRAASVSLVLIACGIVASGFLFGWQTYAEYVRSVVPALGSFEGRDIYYNQGISGFFSRFFDSGIASVATLAVSLVLILVLVVFIRAIRPQPFALLVLTLPVMLLIEPLSWQHHYVFLLPVLLSVWMKARTFSVQLLVIFFYLLISMNVKNPQALAGVWGGNFLLTHQGVGALGTWIIALRQRV
ncbi:MAG: glycosyltransferase family 87 protein [bacterium]|nr:glycosyltransferase family 87 protein [bacterium]